MSGIKINRKVKIDDVDIKILEALEKDSRISLKNLANKLNIKTSTIYHRLNKLLDSKIIQQFSIIMNPLLLGFKIFKYVRIQIKHMVIGKLDLMFLNSFTSYLSNEFEEIIFAASGDDGAIHIIAIFYTQDEYDNFLKELKNNPYVEDIEVINLKNISKGFKAFNFKTKRLMQHINQNLSKFNNIDEINENNQNLIKESDHSNKTLLISQQNIGLDNEEGVDLELIDNDETDIPDINDRNRNYDEIILNLEDDFQSSKKYKIINTDDKDKDSYFIEFD
ncbi:MAG: Lrp/AsnC family transcriptional regulator [Promethearchaeota archaeon]